MSIKIYDCFSYYNEDLVLELRFQTLWDSVDYFIITEGNFTHAGDQKPLNFDLQKFKKYSRKIRYIPITNYRTDPDDFWANENYQRNQIASGLYDAKPDDWIIISDLDEIPNPEAIKNYDPQKTRGDFEQRYFSYFLNNRLVFPARDQLWYGSKITTYRAFVTFFKSNASSVRSYKSTSVLRLFKRKYFQLFKTQKISNGGWHFTWIMEMGDIKNKLLLSQRAHNLIPTNLGNDFDRISQIIRSERDLIVPGRRYVASVIDESFPKPLVTNRDQFSQFILDL